MLRSRCPNLHPLYLCDHICTTRRMVELPTPRLIVILSLLGLASFSLACTLTSRWSHLSNYRACIALNTVIMISNLQSLGVCLLEPCLLPCWRLPSTPSKVNNVNDPVVFFTIINLQLQSYHWPACLLPLLCTLPPPYRDFLKVISFSNTHA